MLKNIDMWFGNYLKRIIKLSKSDFYKTEPVHILFTICDHFEPYWKNNDDVLAYKRVKRWIDDYQMIASRHIDSLGNHPKHCFFYPVEEYKKKLIDMISEICRNGFGETEIHLHHHNDNSINLRKTLIEFKNLLSGVHGLLPINRINSEIRYGFIHGDWALDNSRPDGKCCGVNDEITILQKTGCYADFTMPSAPSNTQTRMVNSIYYAVDDPYKPKSHDIGICSKSGITGQPGLLCIQGPLGFNIFWRKYGIIPRIENGNISSEIPMTKHRIHNWINSGIHVVGRPDIIFVKLYTHGTQEKITDFLFNKGILNNIFNILESFCVDNPKYRLYYVSARQMYNVVKGLENLPDEIPEKLLDYELVLQY